MKKLIFIISILLIIFFLGKDILPTNNYFFTFHDQTQPARIQQFTKELKNFHIPPRIAPDMNYGLGFPIFNFYAPTAYWITSLINLLMNNEIISLKISLLLAIIIAFSGSFLFFKIFFDFYSSLLGGIFYITSLYFPLNIFVRGNLAEIWFLALLPFTLNFIYKNSKEKNIKTFFITVCFISLLITAHNIYSLLIIPFLLIFILILKKSKKNLIALILAFLLSTYFWLPVFLEVNYTWAKQVAISTDYKKHFLCINQLWNYPWGFGGSNEGCYSDGMSFKIGKLQIIFFILGSIMFFLKNKKEKKLSISISLFFLLSSAISLFLTLYQSKFIWDKFSFILSFVQFPWRFIGISLIGISFMSAYFFNNLKINFKNALIFILILTSFYINGKYFYGQKISNEDFYKKYLTKEYIEKKSAYAAAEYLPKSIDYQYWRSLENKKNIPENFLKKASIKPFNKYKQTPIEKISNIITLFTIFGLIFIFNKPKPVV